MKRFEGKTVLVTGGNRKYAGNPHRHAPQKLRFGGYLAEGNPKGGAWTFGNVVKEKMRN